MRKTACNLISLIAIVLMLVPGSSIVNAAVNQNKPTLLVFAAASMKNALVVIGREFEPECQCRIIFSFAGSGTLARQIAAGAPVDLYISADTRWMKWLEEESSVALGSTTIVARNRLVIAIGKDAVLPKPPVSAAQLLDTPRVAMANPDYVPAGRYGRQALDKLGLWQAVSNRLVYGENVRVSLSLVARGDVGAAIIYHSDAKIEPRVRVAYLFDKDDHQPIIYPASLLESGNQEMGEIFLQFLTSSGAGRIFDQFGFSLDPIVGAND